MLIGSGSKRSPPQANSNRWISVKFAPLVTIAVRARKNGRYSYQIFTVAGEPKTLLSSRRIRSYASPAEAAKAGLEAAAVLNCIGRDLI